MTQEAFIKRRLQAWERMETCISRKHREIRRDAAWFPGAYRELTQDLNIARAHAFDPAIIERLNRLVSEGQQILYARYTWPVKSLITFFIVTFPSAIRRHIRQIASVHLLFYGLAVFIGIFVVRHPETIYDIVPEMTVENIESMYDPESEHFLTPGQVSNSADMFGFYIYNNISVAFRTFAGGFLAGFGSLFFLCYNALFLGAVAAHIINSGLSHTFFPFVIGHSSLELTAIIFCAHAGLRLGWSAFITRGLTRRESVRRAADAVLPIVAGSACMLVLAALVEAFWSSLHLLPSVIRYTAGASGWILVAAYFLCAGRRKK